MGWADMLLKLGIPYNSDEGVALGEALMGFINEEAHKASVELAKSRGSFPLFSQSMLKDGAPIRNATTTTIAPTGTLSILANCSSGVEPVFGYVFIRNILDGTQFIEVNPVLKDVLIKRGLYSEELMHKISQQGTLAHMVEIPEDIKRVFVCSHDIAPAYHIKMQAAFQRHTDNAVSKTVNFPNQATKEEVKEVFMLAYKLDCKGVTIYRDGSRDNQVLNISAVNDGKAPAKEVPSNIHPRPRPEITAGITERMKIGCGNLYVTVNYDENGVCEVFTSTGKAGGCPSQSEATARLTSVALRAGVAIEEILDQLKGIRCPSTIRQQGMKCTSCPDAIAKVVSKVHDMLQKNEGAPLLSPWQASKPKSKEAESGNCPECGEKLEHEGGCVSCRSCGYSKCN